MNHRIPVSKVTTVQHDLMSHLHTNSEILNFVQKTFGTQITLNLTIEMSYWCHTMADGADN